MKLAYMSNFNTRILLCIHTKWITLLNENVISFFFLNSNLVRYEWWYISIVLLHDHDPAHSTQSTGHNGFNNKAKCFYRNDSLNPCRCECTDMSAYIWEWWQKQKSHAQTVPRQTFLSKLLQLHSAWQADRSRNDPVTDVLYFVLLRRLTRAIYRPSGTEGPDFLDV